MRQQRKWPFLLLYAGILLSFYRFVNSSLDLRVFEIHLRQAALWFPAILGQSIFRMMGVYNLSVGAQMVLAAGGVVALQWAGLPPWAAWAVVLFCSGLLGWLYGMVRPYVDLIPFTFACQFVLGGAAVLLPLGRGSSFLGQNASATLLAGAVLLGGMVYLYLNHISAGRALPLAVRTEQGQNALGMDCNRVCRTACVLACLLIGISGTVLIRRMEVTITDLPLNYTYRVFMAMAIGNCTHPTRAGLVAWAAAGSIGFVLVNAVCQHFGVNSTALYSVCGVFILCASALDSFQNRQGEL